MRARIILSLVFMIVLFSCTKIEDVNGVTSIGVPELAKPMVSEVKYTKATICSEVCYDSGMLYDVRERGFEWSTEPTFENKDKYVFDEVAFEAGFGEFKYDLVDLQNGTTYYIRAYAISTTNRYAKEENTGYSEVTSFTTMLGTVPTVETSSVNSVHFTTAKAYGKVTADNTEPTFERGFVWSKDENPTYSFNNGRSFEEAGLGDFNTLITNLLNNTKYIVRAYAKSEVGIGYGDKIEITTTSPTQYTITINGVSFEMNTVVGGTFKMGSNRDLGEKDEYPLHEVTLNSYCIGQTEVTQELWMAVMGTNPSYHKGDKLPVENVNWNDCQEFIKKLNAMPEVEGRVFRLPTEAEWEYAARGGQLGNDIMMYSGSEDIYKVAWFIRNSGNNTHIVASKLANQIGLYDMSGNVWEWCQNWYYAYTTEAQVNPVGPETGELKPLRGGAWNFNAQDARVTNRYAVKPIEATPSMGLRIMQY